VHRTAQNILLAFVLLLGIMPDPVNHCLLHQPTNPTRALNSLLRVFLPLPLLPLRILKRIEPPLNILIRHRRLAEHPLQLSFPRISTLPQRRNLRIALRQIARKLPYQLHSPVTRNQPLNMRIITKMQRPRKVADRN
jgi:hypothetical protein